MILDFNEILDKVLSKKGNAFFYTPSVYKNAQSYLFENSHEVISVKDSEDIDPFFNKQNSLISSGLFAYGYFGYEFGYQLEEKLSSLDMNSGSKTAEMLFFKPDNVSKYNSESIVFRLSDKDTYSINNFKILVSQSEYYKRIELIKELIRKGDTYQVNYTVNSEFQLEGSLLGLVSSLLFNQAAKYIAIINNYPELIISISPELFFEYKDPVLSAKPMKGTIKRGINPVDDIKQYMSLQNSSKDKAENIMIVDLLRNDMGKISEIDSVHVENVFEIERFETVYQLTSTINSKAKNLQLRTIIQNLFPCGSVTGAPKIRTMEIINELETYKRGVYTGAIGMITDEKTTFNVPIRTLEINLENKKGRLPIGSGIVWDSDAETEYEEVLIKAGFLINPDPYFQLIESMLVENNNVFLLEYHIKRLSTAADFFLFKFDPGKFNKLIMEILDSFDTGKKYKLRILLDKWGNMKSDTAEITDNVGAVKLMISKTKISEEDKFLYFKTTHRSLYNEEYFKAKNKGCFDVLFMNSREEITEGSRCNIVVRKGDSFITPPVSSGLLNGCYRQHLLDKGEVMEGALKMSDLYEADEIFLCNSVRGMVKVNSVEE